MTDDDKDTLPDDDKPEKEAPELAKADVQDEQPDPDAKEPKEKD